MPALTRAMRRNSPYSLWRMNAMTTVTIRRGSRALARKLMLDPSSTYQFWTKSRGNESVDCYWDASVGVTFFVPSSVPLGLDYV